MLEDSLVVKTSSTTLQVYEDPDTAGYTQFVSIYENVGVFTADVKIVEVIQPSMEQIFQDIELVSYNTPVQGLTVSQLDLQTLRLSGTATNVFAGSNFRLLMNDGSIQTSSELGNYKAVIGWSPPSIRIKNVSHEFQIRVKKTNPIENYVKPVTITQDIYWRYQLGVQAFRDAVAGGVL